MTMLNSRTYAPTLLLACVLGACGPTEEPIEPTEEDPRVALREVVDELGLAPIQAPPAQPAGKIELGRALFFDPETSGNRDAACGMCHRMSNATVDGLSLPVGTKARVMEDGARLPGARLRFVPRNVPDLFNRTHPELDTMFWDTRLFRTESGDFHLADFSESYTPAAVLRVMPEGLDNILAAQNLLPFLNRDELRGVGGDSDIFGEVNELALILDLDFESVWAAVMRRLLAIPAYVALFGEAYPDVAVEDLTIVHAANALSAFIGNTFAFTDSPWDQYLAGDDDAIDEAAARGALVFYGKGQCSVCHSGTLFTDQRFYNIAVPPLGEGPDPEELVDSGATHRSVAGPESRFAFRTPPLRNVALTAPYMHNGTYATLEGVIRHKADALTALRNYDASQIRPEFQVQVHTSPDVLDAVERTVIPLFARPLDLTERDITDLVAFLESLTDPAATELESERPDSVPSGLPVVEPR